MHRHHDSSLLLNRLPVLFKVVLVRRQVYAEKIINCHRTTGSVYYYRRSCSAG